MNSTLRSKSRESNSLQTDIRYAAIAALILSGSGSRQVFAQAASISSMSPPNGSQNIPPDMPMRLTFTSAPQWGSAGKIQIRDVADSSIVEEFDVTQISRPRAIGGVPGFNYYPLSIDGNSVSIYPTKPLGYGKAYYVTMDAGALTGNDGITGTDKWKFTTRQPVPAGKTRIVVAADGSGDFCTIQAAVDYIPWGGTPLPARAGGAAGRGSTTPPASAPATRPSSPPLAEVPSGNAVPTTIFIKKGIYNEIIVANGKHNVTFLGEDRKQTIIQYPNNARLNAAGGPYRRGMILGYRSNDLAFVNMTLHNTTPYLGSQAECLILSGTLNARAIITDVDMVSYQDTLQINGQAYVSKCYIEGDVDFMWGNGPTFFQECTCRSVHSGGYYTQIRNTSANHGYVYYHCLFDGAPGVVNNLLSRIEPVRFPESEVVLINCGVTDAVGDVGWKFDGNPNPEQGGKGVHFWEFATWHVPRGEFIDSSKRFVVSKQLRRPADAKVIDNYSDPTWVLGGRWMPQLAPLIAQQPTATKSGGKAFLSVTASAVPAPNFQWRKNGTDIPGAFQPTFIATDPGTYSVLISNSAGKVTSDSVDVRP